MSANRGYFRIGIGIGIVFAFAAKIGYSAPLPCDGDACISTQQAQAAYTRGMELLKQNKPKEASEALCQATKVTTAEASMTRSRYVVACGTALLKTDDWDTAEVYFQEAERADPGYPMLYSSWGAYAERKNDLRAAVDRYTEYLKLEKDPKRRAMFEPKLAALKAKLGANASSSGSSSSGAGSKPAGGPSGALAAVDDSDCGKICDKLLQCKAGPWSNRSDCVDACDGAREDRVASKTYRCAAAAKSCTAVGNCGK